MRWVDTEEELAPLFHELAGADTYYIDTEFESSRAERLLCLIQVSGGGEPWLIDALKVQNLSRLGAVLGAPNATWVLHAGDQDLELLLPALGLGEPPRVFDTQIAWALLSPEFSVSLAYLEYVLLGKRRAKAHQADDWKRRPLPKSQIDYAARDIEHLPALYRELRKRASELGREDLLFAASAERSPIAREPAPALSLASFRNAWQLAPEQQAALVSLIDWHNELGREARDEAPETKTLLSVASRLPESVDDLLRIKGVPRHFGRGQGQLLLERMKRARATAAEGAFVPIEPPPYATFAEIRTEAWLLWLRAEVSSELSVAPELVLPARLLKAMRTEILRSSEAERCLECLLGWRRELLSGALLRMCQDFPLELRT